jgi:hypothetical protein
MKIGFLVTVNYSLTQTQPTVQIECDQENPPTFIVELAAKHFSAMADQLKDQTKELKVV